MVIHIVELERAIAKQHEKSPFSGVIWVKEKSKIVFSKSYGFANRAEAIPNTLNTRFATASGTKTFTSAAICQLVEKNLLTFDTLLKDCLNIPFPTFDPAISVHHLLTHSSGIPDYFDEAVMDDYEDLWKERPMYSVCTLKDFLPMFQDQAMVFAPGERFSYNNAGYILLGLIVEQVSKLSFQEYVEANIFAICNMTDSGFFSMDCLPPCTAYGYIQKSDQEWRTNIYALPIIGGSDGGAFTTVGDLEKFWQVLMTHQLLSEAILKQMLTPHIPTGEQSSSEANFYYGYGIWIAKQEDVLSYHMLGGDPGVSFYSGMYADLDIQITLMGNIVNPFDDMRNCVMAFLN
ncbi:serine hydrolase domain-containing protein [Phormidesmis sp. 146-12]